MLSRNTSVAATLQYCTDTVIVLYTSSYHTYLGLLLSWRGTENWKSLMNWRACMETVRMHHLAKNPERQDYCPMHIHALIMEYLKHSMDAHTYNAHTHTYNAHACAVHST